MISPRSSQTLLDALDRTLEILHDQTKVCEQLSDNIIYLYIYDLICNKQESENSNNIKLPRPYYAYIIIAYHLLFYRGLSRAQKLLTKLSEVEDEMDDNERSAFKMIMAVSQEVEYITKFNELTKKSLTKRDEYTEAQYSLNRIKMELDRIPVNEYSWASIFKEILKLRVVSIIDSSLIKSADNINNSIKDLEAEIILDERLIDGYNIISLSGDYIKSSVLEYFKKELDIIKSQIINVLKEKEKVDDNLNKIYWLLSRIPKLISILSFMESKLGSIQYILYILYAAIIAFVGERTYQGFLSSHLQIIEIILPIISLIVFIFLVIIFFLVILFRIYKRKAMKIELTFFHKLEELGNQ
ncbi:hypothetical protein SJAV_12260 [Sulfurisphaera javensis]|uniref:Uncharacterized protein n=1 Tax=Sulfurisphaera javensis TaxID=2049879 RepID=A0AAT9GR52_9CREN